MKPLALLLISACLCALLATAPACTLLVPCVCTGACEATIIDRDTMAVSLRPGQEQRLGLDAVWHRERYDGCGRTHEEAVTAHRATVEQAAVARVSLTAGRLLTVRGVGAGQTLATVSTLSCGEILCDTVRVYFAIRVGSPGADAMPPGRAVE